MQRQSIYAAGSIADLIERYVKACPDLGADHKYRYRKLQRQPIALLMGNAYKREDITEFATERRKDVCAATVQHDIVCLSNVLKYAGSGAWKDCRDVSVKELNKAKPLLTKLRLIGKSEPRERRPMPEEIAALLAYFAKQNATAGTTTDMVLLTRWQIASGRRIGESCKLLWVDWNREDRTVLVRKMKDPRNKNKQKVVALTAVAHAMLLELEPLRNLNEPRIFPFKSKTASARYTMAKIALGITNLHLHDSRRECFSRLSEQGYNSNQIRLASGHETNAMLDRVYARADPAKFKDMAPAATTR